MTMQADETGDMNEIVQTSETCPEQVHNSARDDSQQTALPVRDDFVENSHGSTRLKFVFRGSTDDYFKIYYTNVMLVSITLGIYSAWAKVRNKRYFYGNTTLNGHNFDFDASPISILISRVLVIVIVVGAIFAEEFYQLFWFSVGLFSLMLILLFPFAIVRGRAFNARHTLHRSVRFRYLNNYWPSIRLFCLYFFPIVLFFALLSLNEQQGDPQQDPGFVSPVAVIALFAYIILMTPAYFCLKHRIMVNQLKFGNLTCSYTASIRSYYGHAMASFLWGVLISILLALITFLVSLAIYSTNSDFVSEAFGESSNIIEILVTMLIYMMLILGPMAVMIFLAKMVPLFYSSIMFSDGSKLSTTASAMTYFFKYKIVNTFLLVISAGLLLPLVKVRNWRYVTENLTLHLALKTAEVFASKEERITPLAEELADVADFDLDFGAM